MVDSQVDFSPLTRIVLLVAGVVTLAAPAAQGGVPGVHRCQGVYLNSPKPKSTSSNKTERPMRSVLDVVERFEGRLAYEYEAQVWAREISRLERRRDHLSSLAGFNETTAQTYRREIARAFRMALSTGDHDLGIRLVRRFVRDFEDNFLALRKLDQTLAQFDSSAKKNPNQPIGVEDRDQLRFILATDQLKRTQYHGRHFSLYHRIRTILEEAMTPKPPPIPTTAMAAPASDAGTALAVDLNVVGPQSASQNKVPEPAVHSEVAAQAAKRVYRVVFEKEFLRKASPTSKDLAEVPSLEAIRARFDNDPVALAAQLRHHIQQEIISLARYYSGGLVRFLGQAPDLLPNRVKTSAAAQLFISRLYDANCRDRYLGRIERLVEASHLEAGELLAVLREVSAGRDQRDFLVTMARLPFAAAAWRRAEIKAGESDATFREVMMDAEKQARKLGDLDGRVLIRRLDQWALGTASHFLAGTMVLHYLGWLDNLSPSFDQWIDDNADVIELIGLLILDDPAAKNPGNPPVHE